MALKLSKHCKQVYTYGICERCDRCGYMTRRDEYEDLKESIERLCSSSKGSKEKPDVLLKNISDFEMACKVILQELDTYNVHDESIEKLFTKVKILSKFAKKFDKLFQKFIKEIEDIDELSKLVKNRIDF